jgi:arabinogalactan endo-1,4-beta-galactosidase
MERTMTARFAVAAALVSFGLTLSATAADFVYGADLSFANEMDDCGAVYKDGGKAGDVYAIMKAHGTNVVRLRLWNDPTWTKYGNLADVKKSIARAKANGMKVLLDFHYSDDWADGDKQIVPAAWSKLDDDALAKAVYGLTHDTLTALQAAGLAPEYVQVGNETNGEVMMAAATKAPINWTRNAKLLNAGIKAVRDADPKIKVMLHIAQPENVEPWFEAATQAGVTDFDLIGISYYSKWSKLNLTGLGAVINRLRHRYSNAGIWVVETAYAWTTAWNDNSGNLLGEDSALKGYRVSKDGQKQFLVDLTQTVLSNGGSGVVYWAPDWVSTKCRTRWGQGSNWENATLFDFDGNALPAIDYTREAYKQPVTVTFKFRGATPPVGQAFYLWGDFLGTKTFAVRLPANGTFATTMMPGTKIRFQVFDSLSLHTKLLTGDKLVNGFAAETVPANGATFEYELVKPQ